MMSRRDACLDSIRFIDVQMRARRLLVCSAWLLILFFGGCKEKGCTDPKAINYSSTATDDDGSCIRCQETVTITGYQTLAFRDFNVASPHYTETVGQMHVRQLSSSYKSDLCGNRVCDYEISVENQVNQRMTFYWQMHCSGGITFNYSRLINVPANTTLIVDTISSSAVSNPCGDFGAANLTGNVSGTILYN